MRLIDAGMHRSKREGKGVWMEEEWRIIASAHRSSGEQKEHMLWMGFAFEGFLENQLVFYLKKNPKEKVTFLFGLPQEMNVWFSVTFHWIAFFCVDLSFPRRYKRVGSEICKAFRAESQGWTSIFLRARRMSACPRGCFSSCVSDK